MGGNDIQGTQTRIMSTQQEVECQDLGLKLWSSFQAKFEMKTDNSWVLFHDSEYNRQTQIKAFLSSVFICLQTANTTISAVLHQRNILH